MTRLIDADALSELVGEPIEVFLRRLDLKLPPTIDAVPVIRCKDCKWYDEGCNEEESWTWCKSNEMSVEEDFFCRDGERKEE